MGNYLLAHDLGTTGDKATLYDFEGRLFGSKVIEYPTYYPENLFVEQEPEDWWKAVCTSTKGLITQTGISPPDIWNKELVVPRYLEEATSLGATVCAGVGIGAFRDFSKIKYGY